MTSGFGGEEGLASVFGSGRTHAGAAVENSELETVLVESDFEFDRAVWGGSFASILDENDESLGHWLDWETESGVVGLVFDDQALRHG